MANFNIGSTSYRSLFQLGADLAEHTQESNFYGHPTGSLIGQFAAEALEENPEKTRAALATFVESIKARGTQDQWAKYLDSGVKQTENEDQQQAYRLSVYHRSNAQQLARVENNMGKGFAEFITGTTPNRVNHRHKDMSLAKELHAQLTT